MRSPITGTEHPTRDGTGIRDYVHVWDLAQAHVAAVEAFDDALDRVDDISTVINLGTGQGVTVRELLGHLRKGRSGAQCRPSMRRRGRVTAVGAFANVDKARDVLGWRSNLSLADGIESALAWARRRHEVLGYPSIRSTQ